MTSCANKKRVLFQLHKTFHDLWGVLGYLSQCRCWKIFPPWFVCPATCQIRNLKHLRTFPSFPLLFKQTSPQSSFPYSFANGCASKGWWWSRDDWRKLKINCLCNSTAVACSHIRLARDRQVTQQVVPRAVIRTHRVPTSFSGSWLNKCSVLSTGQKGPWLCLWKGWWDSWKSLNNSYLLLVKEICNVKPQYFNILNSSAASWQSPRKVKAHRQRKDRRCWIWGCRAKRACECL